MFTATEKKVIIFLCSLLLLGGILRLAGVNFKNPISYEAPEAPKININTASLEELEKLPSIGPKTAQEIIAHRNQHGPLGSLVDLKKVKGIGEKKLKVIQRLIIF